MCRKFTLGADNWPGLIKLQEEAAEVVSAAAKLIAHPKEPESAEYKAHLEDEIGDVMAAICVLYRLNDLDGDRIDARFEEKVERYTTRHFKRRARKTEVVA